MVYFTVPELYISQVLKQVLLLVNFLAILLYLHRNFICDELNSNETDKACGRNGSYEKCIYMRASGERPLVYILSIKPKIPISDLNEVIPLCYLNIYFITICFRQHN